MLSAQTIGSLHEARAFGSGPLPSTLPEDCPSPCPFESRSPHWHGARAQIQAVTVPNIPPNLRLIAR